MDIAGLLTFAGLILATYALTEKKERKYLFIRINKIEWIITVVVIAALFYLILFDRLFYPTGLYTNYLVLENGIPADILAFIMIVSVTIYLGIFGFKKPIPKTNRTKLLKLYHEELLLGEHKFLLETIEKNHQKEIEKFDYEQGDFNDYNIEAVIREIIMSERFVVAVVNLKPIFFLKSSVSYRDHL